MAEECAIVTPADLRRAALARQLLLARADVALPEALEQVAGLQSQYAPTMYIGCWSRLAGFRREALTGALERRTVVQATMMRSTIHLVSAADYWPLSIATREPRRTWWLRATKSSPQDLLPAVGRVRAALRAEGKLDRKSLDAVAGDAPLDGVGTFLELVRVPPAGTWDRRRADLFALAEDWVGPPPELAEDDALDHLVVRYLTGFGPATVNEIANWGGMNVKDVTQSIHRLDVRRYRTEDGKALVDLPGMPWPEPSAPVPVRFLSTWEAILLVHARRTGVLREADRPRIFHTKAPHSFNTFLLDGVVEGTWRHVAGEIELEPFRPLPPAGLRALRSEAESLAEFHRDLATAEDVLVRLPELRQHGGVVIDRLRRHLPTRVVWTPGLNRFAVAQSLAGAGDALVAVSLAGSLFFSLSPDASRQQVLLYLTINLAPFALLAPLIGPAIDHFKLGHRWIAALLFVLRAVCAAALAFTLFDLALYFFALALLIAAKASGVTRQALVPGLVDAPNQLVAANSRLARLTVIAGAVGGGVGAAILAVTESPPVTLGLACAAFIGAAIATLRLPKPAPAEPPTPGVEYEELHTPTIVATAWAFTAVRAAVGVFVFGLAFALRRESEPAWMYGAAVVAYGAGTFAGSAIAPLLRRRYGEDRLTEGAMIALAVVAAFAAIGASRAMVLLVSLVLGGVASVGRQAFDALVQTRAPLSSHGRAFARFETRFQLAWVAGAVAATAVAVPIQASLGVVAIGLIPAAVLYVRALREAQKAHVVDPFDPSEVARHRIEHALEWHRRDRDRLAITELTGAIDLVRTTGVVIDTATIDRLDALRVTALSTWPLDTREVSWAMEQATAIVEQLGTNGTSTVQAPSESKEEDVTVHCEERRSTVSTSMERSTSER